MGSDPPRGRGLTPVKVSIHAPAWGATAGVAYTLFTSGVSIHAPAWGATCATVVVRTLCRFQFTLPHGERLSQSVIVNPVTRFNSRSRMGSDKSPVANVLVVA